MAIISNAVTMADAGAFSVSLGATTLIKTLTLSNVGTASFVHGASSVVFDNTYPIYKFVFTNMHPVTDNVQFMHNGSINAGTNYNVSKTTSLFEGEAAEGGGNGTLNYVTGHDIAEGTGNAKLTYNCGNDNDQCVSGEMTVFNPSSTTFTKHFITKVANSHNGNYIKNSYTAGYYNTTSDLDAMQFTFSSGNIDSGKIELYGIKDS